VDGVVGVGLPDEGTLIKKKSGRKKCETGSAEEIKNGSQVSKKKSKPNKD